MTLLAMGPAHGAGDRNRRARRMSLRRSIGWLLALPPTVWLSFFYVAAMLALFVTAFWRVDSMTGAIVHDWTLANVKTLITEPVYRTIIWRTLVIAVGAALTDCILAFPLAFYIVFVATRRWRSVLLMLILLPLWSSVLARIYAWRLILAKDGIANWGLETLGFSGLEIGYSNFAVWLVSCYLWLPFVVLPLVAGLERVPGTLLHASSDLGGNGWHTFRRVIFPLAIPGLAAGSISCFSLTLGDFVTPMLVGGAGSDFIGNAIYRSVGVANDLPFAAAFALVPLVLAGAYLFLMKRAGAFEAL